MEGFFTPKELESKSRPDGKRYSCAVCGLFRKVENPRMPPKGEFKKKIMIIGEVPTETDDRRGAFWQDAAGKYLERTLKGIGVDLYEDCLSVYACHCRTFDEDGEDREPETFEVESCRKTTLQYIRDYKPKVVILLGDSALYSVIGNRWKKDLGELHRWRGWIIPDQEFKCWICPTYSPRFIYDRMKRKNAGAEELIWTQDLDQAIAHLNIPVPIYEEPVIEIIEDLSVLRKIGKYHVTAFDYEATGKKPHAEGHRIVCASVADSEDHAWVFTMDDKTEEELAPFIEYLRDPDIFKIAANMRYEKNWSKVILGVTVRGWVHDTMLFQHVEDNRPGITGLKFQTYVRFGVIDYDSEIAPYLRSERSGSKEESANDFNQIDKLLKQPGGKLKLLTYCGYDSINEYRVYRKQYEEALPF